MFGHCRSTSHSHHLIKVLKQRESVPIYPISYFKVTKQQNPIFQEERKSTNLTVYCIFLNLKFADRINCICNRLDQEENRTRKNLLNASLRLSSEDNDNLISKLVAPKNQKFPSQKFAWWILNNQTQTKEREERVVTSSVSYILYGGVKQCHPAPLDQYYWDSCCKWLIA